MGPSRCCELSIDPAQWQILSSLVNSVGVSLLVKIIKVKKGGDPLAEPCVPVVLLAVDFHCSLAIISCLHSVLSIDSQRSSPCTTLVLIQKKNMSGSLHLFTSTRPTADFVNSAHHS